MNCDRAIGVVTLVGHSCAGMKSPRIGAGSLRVDGLLVENRNQAEKSSADQECQQSGKGELPAPFRPARASVRFLLHQIWSFCLAIKVRQVPASKNRISQNSMSGPI
jgi:hypothetical protein